MNKYIKLFKENMLIIIPAIMVTAFITGFLVFGFLDPSTKHVDIEEDIITYQKRLEDQMYAEYSEETYTVTNPYFILNPYEISPLSGLLKFETTNQTSYFITVEGKDNEGDLLFETPSATTHEIPIYGLYADYSNIITIYENINGVKGELIHEFRAQTEPLLEDANPEISIETTPEYFQDGIMIMIPAGRTLPIGIDYNGDVRFYLTRNFSWAPTLLSNGHLLLGTDKLMSDPYYVSGLYEVSYLGKIYKEYKIPGGYHHDVIEKPDGNFLVLTSEFEGTVEDIVIELDSRSGNIVRTWDLKNYIYQTDGMSEMWTSNDWFHNNSIDYNPDTDSMILSGRHQDIVVSINLTTNQLEYVIGDPNNFSQVFINQYFLSPVGEDFEWQYAQHSAIYTPEGIFLLDNGNNKSKFTNYYIDPNDSYTRGVMYVVDESLMTIKQTYQFGKELGSAFYSPYISNVQYLGSDHYMIHSGGHAMVGEDVLNIPAPLYEGDEEVILNSITYEVLHDEVKYHLEIDQHYYRALHTTLYTTSTRFYKGSGVRLGELAETQRAYETFNTRFNFLETVPLKYELTFTKEQDRLVVNGIFDKDDEIYIVLREDSSQISYKIPTSNTAYTAMCLGTFIEDTRELIYYINETNISGTYEIFLIVNNEKYNTYKHVTFD